MKRFLALLLGLAAAVTAPAQARSPLWLRDAAISPDGTRIAFTYKGDIYAVPVAGGIAQRLTSLPGYEQTPVWSPDSRLIAFAADRDGQFDVMVMDAAGGPARRLTSHSAAETPMAFTADGAEVIYSAAIQDPAESTLYPTGRLPEVYAVRADGTGRPRQVSGVTAVDLVTLGTDGSYLYHDQKGLENEWRKHHTSSVARDVWRYDAATGRHTNLTAGHAGEDRNPALSPDLQTVYFLSERGGDRSINVWAMPLAGGEARRVTAFDTHPVRFLSSSPATGMLAMTYDGELYTLTPGQDAEPRRVEVQIVADTPEEADFSRTYSKGATNVTASNDGKQLAMTWRGDIFATTADHETTRRVTRTPAAEYGLSWAPDGRTIYYTTERNGRKELYKATIANADEPNFANATIITEEPLLPDAAADVDRERPVASPDGKRIVFVEDRSRIMVLDTATGQVTQLTDGSQYPQRDGEFTLVWSPDSRHIALEVVARGHDPYYDVAIIDTATGEMMLVTDSGYFDMKPRWALDGQALIFMSERYGMRNHASWGSMNDVMIAFLTRDAYDRWTLSAEDYANKVEAEKAAKKAAESAKADKDKGKKGKKGKKKAAEEAPEAPAAPVYDLAGLRDRTVRLTPLSADLKDAVLTGSADDGQYTLWYLIKGDDGVDLWKTVPREGETARVKQLGDRTAAFVVSADGSTVFVDGETIRRLNTSNGTLTPVKASGTVTLSPAEEREAMLRQVRNEERERFYVADMHGVDWDALVDHYERFLPHINNNYDFAEMLSELLGELNVSHTGGGYRGLTPKQPTASLGLLYDLTYEGPGLRVAEVLPGGPFDTAWTAMTPGAVVETVDGEPLSWLDGPLNGAAGRNTRVGFTLPGGRRVEEVVKPVTRSADSDALYRRWVRRNEQLVDSLSGGRLGYVHLGSMSDDVFRRVYSDALGRFNDREGLVVDTRWNSGGRLHEDIEVLLSGRRYFTQEVRGRQTCDMPSRRWNKPSVMIVNEANYSNAHGTPWVYMHRDLGKTVGAPVPGTMTSVNWVTLQDPSMWFGIPVVGYRTADGGFLENTQLTPDVIVVNNPGEAAAGTDAQLQRAVEMLLAR